MDTLTLSLENGDFPPLLKWYEGVKRCYGEYRGNILELIWESMVLPVLC